MTASPTKLHWYIPQRVIYVKWGAALSLDDILAVNEAASALMDEGIAPVHTLNDTRDIKRHPTNIIELRRRSISLDHPKAGWLIMVTANPFVNYLSNVVPTIGGKTRYLATMDITLALAHLRDVDHTLDWSQVRLMHISPELLPPPLTRPDAAPQRSDFIRV